MEFVTLVNRTSKILQGTWDGRHYDIQPGDSSFPEIQADAFRRQNPLMGSENPRTLEVEYLIGIKELNHDCSPLEQTDAIERWDGSKLPNAANRAVVQGFNGLYSRAAVAADLPSDSTFVKP